MRLSTGVVRIGAPVIAVLFLLLLSTAAQAAFPGQNGKIAYTNFVEQGPPPPTTHYSIFTVNPDGTGLQNLNPDPPSNFEPAWSADGTKIAFSSARVPDSSFDIWFMNADGSGVQRVTSTFAADRQPAWSPDGTKIAFVANLDGNNEIYVINVDGSGLHNVTNNRENQEGIPVWSPDGTKILYSSRTTNFFPNTPHVWVMNADGTNQTPGHHRGRRGRPGLVAQRDQDLVQPIVLYHDL